MKPIPSDNSQVSACCLKEIYTVMKDPNGMRATFFCTKCGSECYTLPIQQEESSVTPSPQAGGASPNTQNTAAVPPVGLSRRDEFAKAALTGFCSKFGLQAFEAIAEYSRIVADLTIAELDRTSPDHA